VTMVMVIGTMDVAMGNLFRRGRTHITHSNAEMQIHTGQRMVAIERDVPGKTAEKI